MERVSFETGVATLDMLGGVAGLCEAWGRVLCSLRPSGGRSGDIFSMKMEGYKR